jgi:hypothetical protein
MTYSLNNILSVMALVMTDNILSVTVGIVGFILMYKINDNLTNINKNLININNNLININGNSTHIKAISNMYELFYKHGLVMRGSGKYD